jgi:hypothetical protein
MTVSNTLASMSGPVPALSQTLARIAFAAALLSGLALLLLHVLKSDLAPSWHMVSEYALGPYGWCMTLCFAALATACASLAGALIIRGPSTLSALGLALLFVAAVGLFMAAMYRTDPFNVAPADASPTGRMHALAVMIGNPAFVLASVLISLGTRSDPLWASIRLQLLLLDVAIGISLGAMIAIAAVLIPRNGGLGPSVPIGWPNRALVLAYSGWLVVASLPLARPAAA